MTTEVRRLAWSDAEIARLAYPDGTMTIRQGFGSGLAIRPGDPPGHFWAVGDRGPNIKVRDAVDRYGLDHLKPLRDVSGAKIMPRIDTGPAIAEFRVTDDTVELLRILPVRSAAGRPVTGLPNPGTDQLLSEPVFDDRGEAIPPDPDGLDTEGLVALRGGGFWVGDEFGSSLVRLDAAGVIAERLLPGPGSRALPAIAARRQLNRGFEALAMSGDERRLFLAFQSPLAHPDEQAHRAARHVRIWQFDVEAGQVVAQFAYPLDPPDSFRRDIAHGDLDRSDIKVSELLWLPGEALLVLERGSHTTKIYRCPLDAEKIDTVHLDIATRPTLEELSAAETVDFPVLTKTLIFSSDDHVEVTPDIEGMILLAPSALLLVNDNDFGAEGAETVFWRISFSEPLH